MDMQGEEDDHLRRVEARLAAMEARQVQRRVRRDSGGGLGGSAGFHGALEPSGGRKTSEVEMRSVTSGVDLLEAVDGSGSESDGESYVCRGRGGNRRLKDSLELSMSMSMAEPAALSASRHSDGRVDDKRESWTYTAPTQALTSVEYVDPSVSSKLVMRRRQLEQQAKERAVSDYVGELPKATNPTAGIPTASNPPGKLERSENSVLSSPIAAEDTRKQPLKPKSVSHIRPTALTSKALRQEPCKEPTSTNLLGAERGKRVRVPGSNIVGTCEIVPNIVSNNHASEHIPSNANVSRHAKDRSPQSKPNIAPSRFGDNQRLEDFNYPSPHNEEDDYLSQEELALRKSLAKLDKRLTDLSLGTQEQKKSQAAVGGIATSGLPVRFRESNASTKSPTLEPVRDCNNNDDVLRTASYGGGTHCRPGQMTSVATRSSSAKRAEISSGLPKSRVRGGGAITSDTATRAIESDGQHKITIKKDLAHLLFQ